MTNQPTVKDLLSRCCKAPIRLEGSTRGRAATLYYVCWACERPCDAYAPPPPPYHGPGPNTHVSTPAQDAHEKALHRQELMQPYYDAERQQRTHQQQSRNCF